LHLERATVAMAGPGVFCIPTFRYFVGFGNALKVLVLGFGGSAGIGVIKKKIKKRRLDGFDFTISLHKTFYRK